MNPNPNTPMAARARLEFEILNDEKGCCCWDSFSFFLANVGWNFLLGGKEGVIPKPLKLLTVVTSIRLTLDHAVIDHTLLVQIIHSPKEERAASSFYYGLVSLILCFIGSTSKVLCPRVQSIWHHIKNVFKFYFF